MLDARAGKASGESSDDSPGRVRQYRGLDQRCPIRMWSGRDVSPIPPSRQVTGVSIYLKKGGWAFIFELAGREKSWFGLGYEPQPRQIEATEEEEETAGVSL